MQVFKFLAFISNDLIILVVHLDDLLLEGLLKTLNILLVLLGSLQGLIYQLDILDQLGCWIRFILSRGALVDSIHQ